DRDAVKNTITRVFAALCTRIRHLLDTLQTGLGKIISIIAGRYRLDSWRFSWRNTARTTSPESNFWIPSGKHSATAASTCWPVAATSRHASESIRSAWLVAGFGLACGFGDRFG